ncbi:putative alpha-galactosidase [Heracleum sosnowskyi]|uniref:Alpha-galactosidase n=1 Tax=Heracleum sosnowskyi TaxID=360622 RepID=A0AAD8HIW7_9APIA|nr:putative alpha-galactosidase [Heracleum sosnowskyi]
MIEYDNLLKIWNLNDYNGVVGVFNCQGAGWCKVEKTNLIHDVQPGTITGFIRSEDIEYMHRVSNEDWCGDAIVFSHRSGDMVYLPKNSFVPITLNAREYEVFTVVPVNKLSTWSTFAAIGLINMFNSGGAIKELKYESEKDECKVHGCEPVEGSYHWDIIAIF